MTENDRSSSFRRRDILEESPVYRSIQEKVRIEARAEARTKREIAIELLRQGVAINIIAPSTELSIEEVQRLQQQFRAS